MQNREYRPKNHTGLEWHLPLNVSSAKTDLLDDHFLWHQVISTDVLIM